ncbi:hypothetical protein OPT61_g1637 [Boeremia exigua]|uniref:Uncharacterized protein n=1 Tax=Boeremia exigua TaxID=749465 RepID=A0ACC2IPK8_9PLEO|nr:hypothetical protein OPT61_g1637 [Boeremia exigua]
MVCREENSTGAGAKILIQNLRLARIASQWEACCTDKYNKWAAEYNRRIDEMNAQQDAKYAIAMKVHAWREQLDSVFNELNVLVERFDNLGDVTPADWDAAVIGKERKVLAIIEPCYPRDNWPQGLPYPNLIAKALYDTAKERYREVVKDIARRGADIMELSRITGDTTNAAGPVTVQRIHEWRNLLNAKEQLRADWVKFEEDMQQEIITMLQGERVLSQQWNSYAWAGKILKTWGLADSDEAKEWVVRVVEDVVERWHLDNGHDAGSDDGMDMDSGRYGTGIPYQRSNVEGCEPQFDEESDTDIEQTLHYNNEFFLPYDT